MQKGGLVVFHNFLAAQRKNIPAKTALFVYFATFPVLFLRFSAEFIGNIIFRCAGKMPHYAEEYTPFPVHGKTIQISEIAVDISKFSTLSTEFSTGIFRKLRLNSYSFSFT